MTEAQDRLFHCFEYLLITGAAAQVAGQGLPDLFPVGIGLPVQQGFAGKQDGRSAVTTLRAAQVGKSGLQRVQLRVLRHAFYGVDGATFRIQRQ